MYFPSKKRLNMFLRTVLIVTLAVFLALPEIAQTHPESSTQEVSKLEKAHKDDHREDFAEISNLCHPGPDCIVATVLSMPPFFLTPDGEARAGFPYRYRSNEDWRLALETPPPRKKF